MKRILVPTDFSSTAEKAFRFAVDIAEKAKGTLILYHNFIPVESTFIGTEESRNQYNTQSEANIVKKLQQIKKKVMGDRTELAVSTIVGHSPLIDNIVGFAENNHIDLIVMGTQGASGLRKIIIGSVASLVLEKSNVPVLLIPEKYELTQPSQFVFATNYQSTDKHALALIVAMAKLYNAHVTVLHIQSNYSTESEKEKARTDFDTYASSLERALNESKLKFHLLETPSVAESIELLDKILPYDVMAMVRRKKTFLGRFFIRSFTENMAYIAKRPLLIVPEK